MMKRISILMLSLGILLFGLVSLLSAKGPEGGDSQKGRLSKVNTNDVYRIFLINNTTNYYSNNGDGSFNPFSQDDEGFEFPKGSNHFCIFESGLVWGGFQKMSTDKAVVLKVGGSTYYHGIQAGKILTYGTATTAPVAESADLAKNRIFRVRPDIGPNTPFASVKTLIEQSELPFIQYEKYTAQQIYDQYVKDWNEWPVADGAPFKDVNGNGVYNPAVDIPGVPGADQTLWYVANDMDANRTTTMYGSPPMGIEMQKTIWGYNTSGALGNTIFERSLVINKSGARIDSMFFTQWSDPDLGGSGSAGSNAAGCDTVLGLGYVYMAPATDATFGSTAPASGFDFLQGPVVNGSPTDVAIFQGRTIKGKKNLGMSGFNFFINSSSTYADPRHSASGTGDFYNLMNGLVGATGAVYINPVTGRQTNFTLSGDPVTSSGWLYKQVAPPGDVRMCQTTGPFSMAAADTQEVVVGMLVSQGADHFSSISKLKFDDRAIKAAYAFNFDLANPPPAPVVTLTAMDGAIVLDWSNQTSANATETYTKKGYKFEGYNVYQIPSKSFNNPKLLATYDVVDAVGAVQDLTYDNASGTTLVKAVQYGTDSGIQRYFSTTQDAIKQQNLINGNSYYYAVTAYSYNGTAQPGQLTLESPPQVFEVIPQAPFGTQLRAVAGDAIVAAHTAGISSGIPTVSVINPGALTGDAYEIRSVNGPAIKLILSTGDTLNAFNMQYQLFDVTKGKVVAGPTGSFGIDHTNLTVDGIQFGLTAVPHYVEGQEISSYSFPPGWSMINQSPAYVAGNFIASSLKPFQVTKDIEIDFLGAPKSGAVGQNAYLFSRTATSGSAGAPYSGFFPQPFTVWDITGGKHRQIDFAFMEAPPPSTFADKIWAPSSNTAGTDREYWFVIDQDYTATAKATYTATSTLGSAMGAVPVMYSGWPLSSTQPAYKAGDKLIFRASVPLGVDDKWAFTTNGLQPVQSTDLAKTSAQSINVWPNPYFGFNRNELNKYQRFVQISHLPSRATIRMFNLAGILVRTISKNDATQFARWDLNNESGLPVAAGMYIIYIDMPDLGTTKTLKLGVIPETQFLDRY